MRSITLILLGLGCVEYALAAPVKHPNLLLNREEIEAVKGKIASYPWAAAALEKTREGALKPPQWESGNLNQALYYAFTGDKGFADRARGYLLNHVNEQTFGSWGISWGAVAWTYDLVHETCSETERAQIERWLKAACTALIDEDRHSTTTPNLIFGRHLNIALVGYCLGDEEVIDWGLNDPGAFGPQRGGFYPVMDSMIRDGHFWAEAPIYALVYDVHSMLALAEAARHHDGTDLYNWVSRKSGASIKSVIDGYLLMGYPLERTGVGQGRIHSPSAQRMSCGWSPRNSWSRWACLSNRPAHQSCKELDRLAGNVRHHRGPDPPEQDGGRRGHRVLLPAPSCLPAGIAGNPSDQDGTDLPQGLRLRGKLPATA